MYIKNKRINVLGMSIGTKNRFVGNPDHANGVIIVGIDGAVVRLSLQVFKNDEVTGSANFRLQKDEAISLIEAISNLYQLNDK